MSEETGWAPEELYRRQKNLLGRRESRVARATLLMLGLSLGAVTLEGVATLMNRARPAKDGYSPMRGRGAREPVNAAGYRDTEHAKNKAAGVHRIVFVGDSFTFGAGVLLDDTYGKRVERTLVMRRSEVWESIVLAVPGIGTQEEAAIVENEAMSYAPDLLVLGYVLNDAEQPDDAERRRAAAWSERQEARRNPSIWRHSALLSLVADRLHASQENRLRVENHLALYRDGSPGLAKVKNGIDRIAEQCRRRGVGFVAVIFPLFANPLDDAYPFEEIHSKVGALLRAAGAIVVDLLPYFRGMDWRLLVVEGARDEHPSELAHRIASQALVSAIESSMSEAVRHARSEGLATTNDTRKP